MQLSTFLKDIMTSLTHIIDNDDHQNDDERKFLEDFLKYHKRHSRQKRTNAIVKEAQKLTQDIQNGEKSAAAAAGKKIKKCPLIGGAIGLEATSTPNAPPKKKKAGNPLKKELSNPQGLDFANQAGALMAQPQKVEMMPPKDMTKEAARPEKTMSGVKNESTKVLRTKANVFDATVQGRRSFTFEYEGTYRNPRFYRAKVLFSVKMIHAPRVATVGSQGYQMFQTTVSGETTDSKYGPIILPNNFADLFFEKSSNRSTRRNRNRTIDPNPSDNKNRPIVHHSQTRRSPVQVSKPRGV